MEPKDNPLIEILLNKYLEGTSTSGEKKELFDLLAAAENENSIKAILFNRLTEYNEDESQNKSVDFDRIYNNMLHEIKLSDINRKKTNRLIIREKTRRILLTGLSMAAVFTIAFFLGTLSSRSDKSTFSKPVIAINYSEIKAPFGSKSEITLPDGTEVILNAGSILKFRSDFNLNNRDLSLVGEAYFKVAKNIDLPLYVAAGNISIKAVGTEFNIKAYDDERTIETTLIEGKVEITHSGQNNDDNQYLDLIPEQKAIYMKDIDSFTLEKAVRSDSVTVQPERTFYNNILISPKVDVDQVVAWTQGKLIIRGENLEKLCVELQRKYDVSIIFRDEEIKMYRFSGVLLDETLEQVLNVIKLTAPIKYSLEGKSVYMSSDKEQKNNYLEHLK